MAMGQRRGIGYAMGAAVLFGASAPLAKALLRNAPPQLLAGLLYAGSGLGLGLAPLAEAAKSSAHTMNRTPTALRRTCRPILLRNPITASRRRLVRTIPMRPYKAGRGKSTSR